MPRVLLVGCGRLGSAFLRGWGERGGFDVTVLDPNVSESPGAAVIDSVEAACALSPDVVVLAVKPYVVPPLLPQLKPLVTAKPVFISVAAGVSLDTLRRGLGAEARIVRAMPNTPAAVLRAVTVAMAAEDVGHAERELCQAVLSAVGEVMWITTEPWMDVVTGLSGSGPAYFYRFAEALAAAGEALGLPADLSMKLARGTLEGAAALAAQSDETLQKLREDVTSPGGTTAAGLACFNREGALDQLTASAAAAAAERSRQLAQEAAAAGAKI